jgi:hypothetical protein
MHTSRPITSFIAATAACLALLASGMATVAHAAEFRLVRHEVVDTEGFGYPALEVLIPAGWTGAGQVIWQQTVAGPDARIAFQATAPDRQAAIELFPAVIGFQSQDPGLNQAHAMYGLMVAPVPDVATFVEQAFIPGVRAHAAGVRMTGQRDLPELGEAERRRQAYLMTRIYQAISPLPFVPQFTATAGAVDLAYSEHGQKMHETVTVTIVAMHGQSPGMWGPVGQVNWFAIALSCRAPAERMPELAPVFAVVATSLQRSPRWDVDLTRLVATIGRQNLQTQQQIFGAMQNIARQQQSIGDEMFASWQERERTRDRVFERWSEANRGVTSWHDPVAGSIVESPGHFGHGWSSGGEYIFTDDPLFNPNVGSTRDWTAMTVR